VCGCGQPDADSDGDGALDCLDACPLHPDEQTAPCSTHRWVTGSWSQCGAECNGVQTRAVVCQAVTGGIVAAAFCSAQPQPAGTRVCNPCGWVTGSWSQCSAECNGVQTRSVVCQSASGMPMPATGCANEPAPAASMVCNVCTFEWVAAGWSACSLQCDGVQIRAVTCMGSNQQPADASQCTEPAPLSQQACNPCSYTWASGTWSTCSAECDGTRTRSVTCMDPFNQPAEPSRCDTPPPVSQQTCNPCSYTWTTGTWSQCSAECDGVQQRTVQCVNPSGAVVTEDRCTDARPAGAQSCQTGACLPDAGVSSSAEPVSSSALSATSQAGASSGPAPSSSTGATSALASTSSSSTSLTRSSSAQAATSLSVVTSGDSAAASAAGGGGGEEPDTRGCVCAQPLDAPTPLLGCSLLMLALLRRRVG